MTVRGEIYVLTSNWRNCAQRFFLTDSEYTFGSFVPFDAAHLLLLLLLPSHLPPPHTRTARTAM